MNPIITIYNEMLSESKFYNLQDLELNIKITCDELKLKQI